MSVILGHTLGTPHLDLFGAVDLFAASELDGIEVIWQNDYKSGMPENESLSMAPALLKHAKDAGLVVGCLTPYITDINNPDPEVRKRDIERYKVAIATAAALECTKMRVYGGQLLGHEPEAEVEERWGHLVDSLGCLAKIAEENGVVLTVENHFSTMTVSATRTAELIKTVGSPFVQALYDQANLAFTHQEDYPEAIAVQSGMIGHVHVKDLEFIDENRQLQTGAVASIAEDDRVHYSRMSSLLTHDRDWNTELDRHPD